jgi:hypothetical protein
MHQPTEAPDTETKRSDLSGLGKTRLGVTLYFCCPCCEKKLKSESLSSTKRFRCPRCRHVFCVAISQTGGSESRQTQVEACKGTNRAKRRIPWPTVLMVVVAFLAGYSVNKDGATSGHSFEALGWKEYAFPIAKMRIALPRPPLVERQDQSAYVIHALVEETDLEFHMHVFRILGDREPKLDEVQQRVLSDYPGSKMHSSKSFKWGGQTAMEFRLTSADGEVVRRLVFAKDRVYALSIAAPSITRHDQSIQRFLNSLWIDCEAEETLVPEVIGEPLQTKAENDH